MPGPSPITVKLQTGQVNFPCPAKMKKWCNNVLADLKSIRGRSGINMRLRQFPDGTEYNAEFPRQLPPQDRDFPFRVVQVSDPNDTSTPYIGVISDSHLFNSEDKDVYEEDNSDWGLLNDDQTPFDGFIAVGDLNLGDKIWLEIELDPEDQSITSIQVKWGPVQVDNWDEWPDPIAINSDGDPYQQFFNQIIAEVTDPDQDPRDGLIITKSPSVIQGDTGEQIQITQLLRANLMMTTAHTTMDADQIDIPLLVAVPWLVSPGTALDGSADELPPDPDQMTPWQFGSDETLNDYNFELFNASEENAAKVLVLDGVVYGPNEDAGTDPEGMPSNDTFTLDVQDGWEIWLQIVFDIEEDDGVSGEQITSVTIAAGETTPDDAFPVMYITIGNVSVDDSGDVPIVTCRNEVCGDVVIQMPPDNGGDGTDDLALVVDKDTGNRVWKKVCGS